MLSVDNVTLFSMLDLQQKKIAWVNNPKISET